MGDRKKVAKKVEKTMRKGGGGIRARSELTGVGEGIVKGGLGRLQSAGPCQHSMGICDAGSVGCAAVHAASEGSRVSRGQLQATGARQHSMGVCDHPFS